MVFSIPVAQGIVAWTSEVPACALSGSSVQCKPKVTVGCRHPTEVQLALVAVGRVQPCLFRVVRSGGFEEMSEAGQ